MTPVEEAYVKKIYYSPVNPASFGGVEKLYRVIVSKFPNITRYQIRQWLGRQESWSLLKPVKRRFSRRPIIASGVKTFFQIDLVDFNHFSSKNGGFKYILLCLDCFSRKLYSKNLKTKQANETVSEMRKILLEIDPDKKMGVTIHHDAGGSL
jgi:hypothetical protein